MRGFKLVTVLVAAAGAVIQLGSAGATTTERGYVTNTMQFPTTNTQANALGRDMVGDGRRENRLGKFYAALANEGLDLTQTQNEAITFGDILMLHSLRTSSLANTKNATWQILYGEPTSNPDFSGTGSFTVQTAPRSLRLAAEIKDHRARTVSGAIPVRFEAEDVFTLRMTKARVFATCIRQSCSDGRINGAVSEFQVKNKFIPELAQMFTAWIMRDCTGGPDSCAADSEGKSVQAIFDADDDMTVTEEEIRTNSLVEPFLKPDLDLVKNDGIKDALSFGFGFTAVRAQLVR